MTGTSKNPLKEAMVGRDVQLSKSEVVLPHYTDKGEEMVIPIERVARDDRSGDPILHPSAGDRYLDGSLILTPKGDDRLIIHGVPQDGPSANFFLTLTR